MVNVHDLNLIRNACISGVAQLNTECNRGAGLLAEIGKYQPGHQKPFSVHSKLELPFFLFRPCSQFAVF